MDLKLFTNDRFLVLYVLYTNQIDIKGEKYISLSQQEIADLSHLSKWKTNKIINDLLEYGVINIYSNTRGKYTFTTKGIKLINYFNTSI